MALMIFTLGSILGVSTFLHLLSQLNSIIRTYYKWSCCLSNLHSWQEIVPGWVVPVKCHIHPEPQNETLFGSRIFADIVKVRSYWRGMGPKSSAAVLKRKPLEDTEGHTGGRLGSDQGRWGWGRSKLGSQRMVANTRSQVGGLDLLQSLQWSQSYWHLDFRLLASWTVRQ